MPIFRFKLRQYPSWILVLSGIDIWTSLNLYSRCRAHVQQRHFNSDLYLNNIGSIAPSAMLETFSPNQRILLNAGIVARRSIAISPKRVRRPEIAVIQCRLVSVSAYWRNRPGWPNTLSGYRRASHGRRCQSSNRAEARQTASCRTKSRFQPARPRSFKGGSNRGPTSKRQSPKKPRPTPDRNGRRAMKSPVIKRSIVIAGHKTSVSLEDAFWKGLKDIAVSRHMTLSDLVASIDTDRRHGNLSSAIRLFVLDHYRGPMAMAKPHRHRGISWRCRPRPRPSYGRNSRSSGDRGTVACGADVCGATLRRFWSSTPGVALTLFAPSGRRGSRGATGLRRGKVTTGAPP